MTELIKHPYKYFSYELEFAKREAEILLSDFELVETDNGFFSNKEVSSGVLKRLVYFSSVINSDKSVSPTTQALLEKTATNTKRQATRYSVHGLHEYKGKFNPQVVKALLNMFEIKKGDHILDPFCGSGTSLIESAHLGIHANGTDINPLAVYIANAKLEALKIDSVCLREELEAVLNHVNRFNLVEDPKDKRVEYLLSWFDRDIYELLEKLKKTIEVYALNSKNILLVLASNLLREYSQQDPNDLRIRRRKSPLPETPFLDVFKDSVLTFIERKSSVIQYIEKCPETSKAINIDIRNVKPDDFTIKFDAALTSPPYATALPYIDTQRLSLVWLGLIPSTEILPLESRLIGSREVRGKVAKDHLFNSLLSNLDNLPQSQADYCIMLQNALTEEDGFRRQAVPILLYRYFVGMKKMFSSVHSVMKPNAPFGLIVGGNHTVLSGHRFDIDTPQHLAEIAEHCGWKHIESIPLQTYQRYGYHQNNAINTETLIILRSI
ncbi:DNA methylase [Acinetobacter baumannii]|uniref:TRM11 family SAM-dependent methyltransferase n=1 Tax=Acinetobacter baumannii TaxID=470 RepID=UPI0021BED0C4|nr:DNA methylase [Acinetobacter baumannii]MDC5265053.1 DNA methyltransferase [Acinetobacter baumannii]MDC5495887.1 DNA methyltransferase [Acinetobacter baumannii]MDC5512769.1 DNA methyltransferase [Acinetobacter baumannii]MDN8271983.1 DNA methyltransferase [Acinetobacter baumannii]